MPADGEPHCAPGATTPFASRPSVLPASARDAPLSIASATSACRPADVRWPRFPSWLASRDAVCGASLRRAALSTDRWRSPVSSTALHASPHARDGSLRVRIPPLASTGLCLAACRGGLASAFLFQAYTSPDANRSQRRCQSPVAANGRGIRCACCADARPSRAGLERWRMGRGASTRPGTRAGVRHIRIDFAKARSTMKASRTEVPHDSRRRLS